MGEAGRAEDSGVGIHVPSKGDLLAGKYRVEGILGMGGMGMVIAARHEHLDERVALKTLLPSVAKNEEVRKRFQREARAAFKLQNDNVCRVLDAGELEDGSPFLVMEYLSGDNLATVLTNRGPLPLEEAVDYVIQACTGVAAAHDIGIVHRDIKPSNLVLATRSDGTKQVKVIDFGISKLDTSSSVTRTFAYIGSPIYSAPEQLKSARAATSASDVWSMGVVLYQLALGCVPFDFADDTFAAIIAAIDAGPVPPSEREPGFPKGLEAIIMRALAADPADRWPSMRAFADALAPYGSARAASTPSVLPTQRAPEPPTQTRPPETAPLPTPPMKAPAPAPVATPAPIATPAPVQAATVMVAPQPPVRPSYAPPPAPSGPLPLVATSPGVAVASPPRRGAPLAAIGVLAVLSLASLAAAVVYRRSQAAADPIPDDPAPSAVVATATTPSAAPTTSTPAASTSAIASAAPPVSATTASVPASASVAVKASSAPTIKGTGRFVRPPPTATDDLMKDRNGNR